jgi:hypothetical protein
MTEQAQKYSVRVIYRDALTEFEPTVFETIVYAFDEARALEFAKQCFLDVRADSPTILRAENITRKTALKKGIENDIS